MELKKHIGRRNFLKKTLVLSTAAAGLPALVPSSVFGRQGRIAPGDKVIIGSIGLGMQGNPNTKGFLDEPDTRVVALCDIDANHLRETKQMVDDYYGNRDCAGYHDFQELLAREDIDAVMIALPDHWHGVVAVAAAKAGKDIYGEKPLAHSIVEGRAICTAVQRYGRVWQTGSWQRSQANFRFAAELVINGRIGRVHTAEVGLPAGHTDFAGTFGEDRITAPPPELDYDLWLGPAPYTPYVKSCVHRNWRWNLNYGGGQITDWVGHHLDIAHWGLGMDYSGPVEIEGKGEYPKDGLYNTATKYKVHMTYPNGIHIIMAGGYPEIRGGTKWIGDKGWVWVNRGGAIEAEPQSLLRETIGPNEINFLRSPGHTRNFLDCVKARATTLTPCEVAHRSASPGHLGQIAMLLERKIRYNPGTEEIIGDSEASRMLGHALRSPWHL